MQKTFAILALILMTTMLRAETQSPWFGSEASPAEQIDLELTASVTQVSDKQIDCAIYNCARSAKIATPPQKGTSNP